MYLALASEAKLIEKHHFEPILVGFVISMPFQSRKVPNDASEVCNPYIQI
jgi:hypothetical protein